MHVLAHCDWADDFVGVESVDPDSSAIHLADRTGYNIVAGCGFYVHNVVRLVATGEPTPADLAQVAGVVPATRGDH